MHAYDHDETWNLQGYLQIVDKRDRLFAIFIFFEKWTHL